LFGAAIINPTYIGKTTRSLRKAIPLITGYGFYKGADWLFNKNSYLNGLIIYDGMPYNFRRYMETKDHRYLATLDLNDLNVKKNSHENKKSLY